MAKRFTDTKKWDDPWFAELPSKYKLFWLYLLDECDHAGIWKVNFRKAQFMVGESLEQAEVARYLSDRIRKLDDTYWLVLKFIDFQYNGLKGDKVSLSAIQILEKHGLTDFVDKMKHGASMGLPSSYQGSKDKDKDMVKGKGVEKDIAYTRPKSSNDPELIEFFTRNGSSHLEAARFFDYYDSQSWMKANNMPISNWQSSANAWIRKSLHDPTYKNKAVDPNEEARKLYGVNI